MTDVNCPNCKEPQEINHDDGYGYEEDKTHEQECYHCGEIFEFTTQFTIDYMVYCKDGQHDLEAYGLPHAELGQYYQCKRCDYSGFPHFSLEEQS